MGQLMEGEDSEGANKGGGGLVTKAERQSVGRKKQKREPR